MAVAGVLEVQMLANLARLSKDMNQAKGMVTSATKHIEGAISGANRILGTLGVGLSIGAFAAFIKRTIDSADALNDLRTRTGLAGQELLVLQGAAARSGVEMGAVGDIATRMTSRLTDASRGTGDAAEGYRALGIDVKNAGGSLKSIFQILTESGAKFREWEDGPNKAAIAIAAFGKGGDRLIPMVEAIQETTERLQRLGVTIDDEFITKADAFNDKIEDMKAVQGVLARQFTAVMLPYLEKFVDVLIEVTRRTDGAAVAINAIVIPLKVFATGFLTVGTAAAAAGDILAGFVRLIEGRMAQQLAAYSDYLEGLKNFDLEKTFDAAKRLMSLDFSKNVNDWNDAVGRATARAQGLASVVSTIWDGKPSAGIVPTERPARRPAPGLPDLNGMRGAADAAADAERRLLDLHARLKLEALKDAAQREQELLDMAHQDSLISDRNYYSRRLEIQRGAFQAELAVINEQIARQEDAANRAPRGTRDYFKALADLAEAQAKRNKLEADFGQFATKNYLEAQRAAENYRRTVQELDIQLAALRGNDIEATRLRLELQNEQLRRQFTVNNDTVSLGKLDEIERLTMAQAQFNQEREKLAVINTRLGIEEGRIQTLQRVGAIGELEALRRTEAARRAQLGTMEAQVIALENIAKAAPNLANIMQAEQARAELENLRLESNLVAQKFDTIFSDAMANAFNDFISGAKSAKEAMNDFGNAVVAQVNRLIIEDLSKKLFSGFTGGGIGSLFSTLFGGGAGAGALAGAAASAGASFATGTDYVPRTGLALVHKGERIITAEDNKAGRAPVNISIVQNFPSGADKRSVDQAAAAAGRAVNRAMARNG